MEENTVEIKTNSILILLTLILVAGFVLINPRTVSAEEYKIIQLDSGQGEISGGWNKIGAQIEGNQVTWATGIADEAGEQDREIRVYDINANTTVQLTNNDYEDQRPQTDRGQVVWESWDGHDREIFLYNGTENIQLTANDYEDIHPQIDNGQVIWLEKKEETSTRCKLYLYDGNLINQIADNIVYSGSLIYEAPHIHKGKVVWTSSERIMVYDISNRITTEIVTGNRWDYAPQISNNYIVWKGWDSYNQDIFLYNIATATITQITNDSLIEYQPSVDDIGNIAWRDSTGRIKVYNIETDSIIDIAGSLDEPQIDDGQVIWGGMHTGRVFLYDLKTATITQIVNYGQDNFIWVTSHYRIDKGKIVWIKWDWHSHWEIFLAIPARPTTEGLIGLVRSMNLGKGIENSLIVKLNNALARLEAGQNKAVINLLNAFINEAEALEGKKLTEEQAGELINYTRNLIESIE